MNIIVCVKEIIDPGIPAKAFKIDPEAKRALKLPEIPLVISDYDEIALEAALQIKERIESKVTVLSLGAESAKDTIRRCIAMGADEGILVSDPLFDDSDSFAVASVLSQVIKKLGDFDLILCGRQEGDWDAGQVGSGIGELLHIPSTTTVAKIEVENGKAIIERVVEDGREIVEIPFPAVLTISSEFGEPRYPSLRRVREAAKKEIPTWTAQHIPPLKPRNKMLRLFTIAHEVKCELIGGETEEEKGINLAKKLKEVKAI